MPCRAPRWHCGVVFGDMVAVYLELHAVRVFGDGCGLRMVLGQGLVAGRRRKTSPLVFASLHPGVFELVVRAATRTCLVGLDM